MVAYTAELGINDLLFGVLGFVIILTATFFTKSKYERLPGNEHYRYYTTNVVFKLFFALCFAGIYLFYYEGGDTMAYYKGAQNLNNLLWQSPKNYFAEMLNPPTHDSMILHYNSETGFPPRWIYLDTNSFYVSKILSVIMIFTGQSYILITLLLSYISAIFSWRIYELVRYYNVTSDRMAAIAVLFVPSVSFWCAGLSKDTFVFISVLGILYNFFTLVNKQSKYPIRTILYLLFFSMLLYNMRSFMLFTVLAPLLLSISTRIVKRYSESAFIANIIRVFIIMAASASFLLFILFQGATITESTQAYLNEAEIQQTDFAQNQTYGDKRYDLGITSFTPTSMITIAPRAIFIAVYRPGLWEARSPLLLISGLETFIFLILTIRFFFHENYQRKIKIIRSNEFLVFSFIFAIILAYFAGYTSILFGVLVRIKAPLLPFLLLVLVVSPKHFEKTDPVENE